MLAEAVTCLACPLCGHAFADREGSLVCAEGHSFDVARHGYVSLLRGDAKTGTADTADMVAHRERFQSRGRYEGLADTVATVCEEALEGIGPGCVVDVGGGTGYYLAAALDRASGRAGIALDLSKHAARKAASAHPRAISAVADTWSQLPVASDSAALVLDVFAPRNAEEFARVLRPDGALVVVTAEPGHLGSLVDALGMLSVDDRKAERLGEALGTLFRLETETVWRSRLELTREDIVDLVLMGPSAWHVNAEELRVRVAELPEPFGVDGAVRIGLYRLR